MNIIKAIALSLLFICATQSQQVLTLERSLSIALKESFSIKSAEYSLISSQKALEAVKLGLMTSVDLEFDLPRYARTLSSEFNPATGIEEFYNIGYTTFEGRLLFTQPIVITNGTFSLVGSMWRRDQFNQNIDLPIDYYNNLSLRLQQPLFTFNNQKANLQRAEINLANSQRNYTGSEKEIIYNVTAGFYRLYQAKKNVEITKERVSQNETSYSTAINKYKAGLIAEVEALQLEVDLSASRSELLYAEAYYIEAMNDFKLLIGLDLKEAIEVAGNIEYNPVSVDVNQAIEYALASRPDLLNAESEIGLRQLNVDEIDSRGNISAMLTANYGVNKSNQQFRELFHDFSEDRSVVLTLNIPVIDWGKNNREVESAEANLSMTKLAYVNHRQQIEKEITETVNRLESAKARVEVLSRSVDVAEKSYNISLARFQSGNITSFDLSQMQLRLTDAKTNSLNALIDYNLALADLSRKTLHQY